MNEEKLLKELEILKHKIENLENARYYNFKSFLKNTFTKSNRLIGISLAFIVTTLLVYADTIVKPFDFADGQIISASEMNSNFDALYTKVNDLDLAMPSVNTLALSALDCANGEVAKFNGTDWICSSDATATAGTDTLNSLTCTTDQVVKFNGTDWVCSSDTGITSESDPNVNALAKATLSCATDQIVKFNGTNWICATDSAPLIIRDVSRNLRIQNNASNLDTQMDISADEIILQNSANQAMRVTNVSSTVDMTAGGANGRDAGVENIEIWYYIWVISDGSTTAGLLSESNTSPAMPSGYIYKALAGAVYNDNSGNLIRIIQVGNRVIRPAIEVVTGGSVSTPTLVDLSAAVPPAAKFISGHGIRYNDGIFQISPTDMSISGYGTKSLSGATLWNTFTLVLVELQTIYYNTNNGLAYIHITEWQY